MPDSAAGDYNAEVTRTTLAACLTIAGALAGCSRAHRPITVGSKSSTEQAILGEILAQHLEKKLQTRVERRLNLGGTLMLHQSLLEGQIDVYPEYAGAAYVLIVKLPLVSDPDVVRERLKLEYEAQHLLWLAPLGFGDQYAMVVRSADARAAKLETLSDAAQYKPGWSLGVTEEFMDRLDGYPLLIKTYNLPVNGAPKMTDVGEIYRSLGQKQANMVVGGVTDGALAEADCKALRDDQGVFLPDPAALAVRGAALQEHPGLRQALEQLLGKFSVQAVRRLNHEVDFKHRHVEEVAKEFLSQAGL